MDFESAKFDGVTIEGVDDWINDQIYNALSRVGVDNKVIQQMKELGINALSLLPEEAQKEIQDNKFSAYASTFENMVSRIQEAARKLGEIRFGFGSNFFGGLFSGAFSASIPGAASGGIFTSGDIFSANENGNAEYIGRYGNSTAVVNNGQIIEGITTGVASGQEEQNSLLRRQNEILLQLLNKQFVAKVSASSGLGRVNSQSGAMYERMAGG